MGGVANDGVQTFHAAVSFIAAGTTGLRLRAAYTAAARVARHYPPMRFAGSDGARLQGPARRAEFTAIQALDTEAVEDELAQSGIPVPPTMNDMDMRMMLVEMRMRKAGKVGSATPAEEGAGGSVRL